MRAVHNVGVFAQTPEFVFLAGRASDDACGAGVVGGNGFKQVFQRGIERIAVVSPQLEQEVHGLIQRHGRVHPLQGLGIELHKALPQGFGGAQMASVDMQSAANHIQSRIHRGQTEQDRSAGQGQRVELDDHAGDHTQSTFGAYE